MRGLEPTALPSGMSVRCVTLCLLVVAPMISAISFGEDPINEGDTTAVQCTVVKGDQPVRIQWTFQGRPLEPASSSGVEVSKAGLKISTLSIDLVQARHSGEYRCSASNKAGNDTQSALLNVIGSPGVVGVCWLR